MKTVDLTNKTVLIIGSGSDLNGRNLGRDIDAGNVADVIIRLNKFYGDPQDVGSKIDIAFARKFAFLYYYFPTFVHAIINCFITEERDMENEYHEALAKEIGVKKPSCGALAIWWTKKMNAKEVKIIGYGFKDGQPSRRKTYTDGSRDNNPEYEWVKENEWVAKNATLL